VSPDEARLHVCAQIFWLLEHGTLLTQCQLCDVFQWRIEFWWDSENFVTRITGFGVTVAKIWRKEVIGTYLYVLEVARAISRIIFENQGSS
jgi:hypothetical protein